MTPSSLLAPTPIEDATRRQFVTGVGAAVLAAAFLAACGDGEAESEEAPPAADTRTIDGAFGPVEVPTAPRRVVSLNIITLEAALLLPPERIVALGDFSWASLYEDTLADHPATLVAAFETDLEELIQLDPDVILDGAYEGELFSGLDAAATDEVAPVAAFNFTNDGEWKEYFRFYADAVGERAAAEDVLAAYEARVERLRDALGGAEAVSGITVSSLIVRDASTIQDYRHDSFSARILDDIGFGAPETSAEFSLERLREADADYVFAWSSGVASEEFEGNLSSPLWDQLTAKQNGHLYTFAEGHHWFGFGPRAANLVLDDLFAIFEVTE